MGWGVPSQVVWCCTDQQALAAQLSGDYVSIIFQGSDPDDEIDTIVDYIYQTLAEAD
ncbi:hypothetical protein PMHK_16030 [Pseudomonas sp. MHK4]